MGGIDPIKWSPDGKSLAALCEETHFVGRVLWVDLDSGTVRPLPRGGLQAGFGFSPDGRRIAYTTVEGHRTEMYADMVDSFWRSALQVVDLETGTVETLLRGIPNGMEVSWSPAGTHILYADLHGEVLYELATGRRTRLRPARTVWGGFQWSPDGREILTTTTRVVDEPPDRCEVYGVVVRLSRAGREIGRWETSKEVSEISYHPDGKRIVWVELGERSVHVAALDGSNRSVVEVLPEVPAGISWSPAP